MPMAGSTSFVPVFCELGPENYPKLQYEQRVKSYLLWCSCTLGIFFRCTYANIPPKIEDLGVSIINSPGVLGEVYRQK